MESTEDKAGILRRCNTTVPWEYRGLIRGHHTYFGLRNAALFTLMHDAGLRTCEAIGLKTCDIRQDTLDGQAVTLLTLKGKGGKERVV